MVTFCRLILELLVELLVGKVFSLCNRTCSQMILSILGQNLVQYIVGNSLFLF